MYTFNPSQKIDNNTTVIETYKFDKGSVVFLAVKVTVVRHMFWNETKTTFVVGENETPIYEYDNIEDAKSGYYNLPAISHLFSDARNNIPTLTSIFGTKNTEDIKVQIWA